MSLIFVNCLEPVVAPMQQTRVKAVPKESVAQHLCFFGDRAVHKRRASGAGEVRTAAEGHRPPRAQPRPCRLT